jgi:queuine/archaeosine tRNA-ribosyltransferase
MQEVREAIENRVFEKYVTSFYEQRGKAVPVMS